MAKALIKLDVRAREALLSKLKEQELKREAHGERAWSFYINDDSRHIGYVMLDWKSFESLRRFLNSTEGQSLIDEWPCMAKLEIIALRNMREDYGVK